MGGGTGCLPGRDPFNAGLHENVSTRDDFTQNNLQSQHNIVPAKRDTPSRLYDKNCPALAGIPVERTGIPLCRDGTKNVPANILSI